MPAELQGRSRWTERFIAAAVVLAVGTGVIAIMLYNRRTATEIANEIYVPRHTAMTPEIQLLQEYVRIDTSNPPGNEIAGATWLGQQLQRAGVPFEIVESSPGRANLYARIKGRTPGGALLLLNHIDVVPAPSHAGWTRPPFSGSIVLNMLHGRGTLDMKGIAICQLQAFIAVARSGRVPDHDLAFLAVSDEEEGGGLGIQWLLQNRPTFFEGIGYVLNEGGLTEMEREGVTYFGIEIGSKQTVDLTLVAPKREQLQRARIALEPFVHAPDPAPVDPGVRASFRAVAPNRLEGRDLLENIDHTIAVGKFWLVPTLNRELMQNTVWPFGVRPSGDGYSMRVILSNLPDENPEGRIEWLSSFVKPYGAGIGTITRREGPAPISRIDTPLFTILVREAQRQLHPRIVGPEVLPLSTTDSRFLRERGIVCYGFLPFPVDFFQSQGIHGVDERVRLDWFMAGVRTMRGVVESYAFGQ